MPADLARKERKGNKGMIKTTQKYQEIKCPAFNGIKVTPSFLYPRILYVCVKQINRQVQYVFLQEILEAIHLPLKEKT